MASLLYEKEPQGQVNDNGDQSRDGERWLLSNEDFFDAFVLGSEGAPLSGDALRFTRTSSQGAFRTASVPSANSAYTILAWFYLDSDPNDYQHFLHLGGSYPSYDGNTDFVGTDNNGTTFRWGCAGGTSNTFATGSALSTGTWYKVAMVRSSATDLKIYLAAAGNALALEVTLTNDVSGRAASSAFSAGTYNGYPMDGRMSGIRIWTAALSTGELATEFENLAPSRTADLYLGTLAYADTVSELLDDQSVNARDLTGLNTPTTAAGPTLENPGAATDLALAATEAPDTASLTVAAVVTIGATEAADVAAFDVAVPVTLQLGATEGADTAAITVNVTASLAATEAPDVAAITVRVTAELAATEAPDSASLAVNVTAVLAATEEADAAAFAFEEGSVTTLALAATEQADTASFTVAATVALAATEQSDSASFTVAANVSLAATEAPDTAAIEVSVALTLAATEESDTASITIAATVDLAATEQADTAAFAFQGTETLDLAATEGSDVASFDILAPIPEPDITIGGTLLTPPRSRLRDREEERAREALAAAERAAKEVEANAIEAEAGARALRQAEAAVQRLQAYSEVNAALVQRMQEQLAAIQTRAAIERARLAEEEEDAEMVAIVLAALA